MISPKMRTSVTEQITASTFVKRLSKNIGSVSMAAALHKSKVTSIQWCLSITGKMREHIFCTSGFPIESTSSESLSIDARPIVKPDISPANSVQPTLTPKFK